MSIINQEFEDFGKKVYTNLDSMPSKKAALRLAFFAGAICAMHQLAKAAHELPEELAKKRMDEIADECQKVILEKSIELELKKMLAPLGPVASVQEDRE